MPVQKVTTLEQFNASVSPTEYSKASLKTIGVTLAEVQGVYPFKVRFQDLGYPGFSSSNVPGIGIAIIGSTFYIL
jgi:hypothetical protein